MSIDYHIIVAKIIAYVNERDIFWLHELKLQLQLDDIQIMGSIRKLKKRNHIQCCERKGNKRQYIVICKVDLEIFNTRKIRDVKVTVKRKTPEEKQQMSDRMKKWHKLKNK